MVLGQILRNVQNGLMLASVLLVVLALQRLQCYEFPHQLGSSAFAMDEGSHPAAMMDESTVRVGIHHQVVLGREFHVGLFRFFLPRLEKTDEQETALKQDWEIVEATSSIHYVVDLSRNQTDLCHLLDGATILHQSLEQKNVLHAIVSSDTQFHDGKCNATAVLSKVGYQVVSVHEINKNECSELWHAYALQNLKHADVVVHLPATGIAIHTLIEESSRRHQRKLHSLSSSVYSSSQSIQFLQPKTLYKGSSVNKNCSAIRSTACHSSPCRISKDMSLVIPPRNTKKCPLPWSCQSNTEGFSSSCRSYHYHFTQQRAKWMKDRPDEICRNNKYVSIHESDV